MQSPEQAVLLIHGAGHTLVHYHKVTSLLECQGIRAMAPCLPSSNNVMPPSKSLPDDLVFIRDLVSKEAAAGTHLLVLAHSYGGVVAAGAFGDFAVPQGSSAGGVTQLLFMAAFIPFEGQSLDDLRCGIPPFLTWIEEDDRIIWNDPVPFLYQDVEPAEAEWAVSQMVTNANRAHFAKISSEAGTAAWREIPFSYLFMDNDKAVPIGFQEKMVGRVKDEGVAVREFRCTAGHSPFLVMPEKVVEVVLEILGRF